MYIIPKSRTAKERVAATMPAIAARDNFLRRLAGADRDTIVVMMVEAIDMHLAANGLDPVGGDGRAVVSVEEICASHCLRAAREAFALRIAEAAG